MEDRLSRAGRTQLVAINREAGCDEVYFLEPSGGNDPSNFGVLSIWKDQKMLNDLKNNKKYRTLQNDLSTFIESVIEEIYDIAHV
jgi:quinol monooxygenase YgiN